MFSKEYFEGAELEATKTLMEKIWSGTKEDKLNAMKEFLEAVCSMYNIPVPEIMIVEQLKNLQLAGIAQPDKNRIVLCNYSFVTFLHEFRHMAQQSMALKNFLNIDDLDLPFNSAMNQISIAKEEDARGYSVSLFYILAKEKYEKAVEEGKLAFK
jgi:hypothetical protein